MAVVFDVSSMQSDLKAFSKAAGRFLDNKTRLDRLESQLASAVADAKRGNRIVTWSTSHGADDEPIITKPSSSYRNHGTAAKQLFAEISFSLEGELLADAGPDRLVVSKGGTRVKLKWAGSGGITEVHFDIHKSAAGHPMLHVQMVGEVKEIPRVLSIFAHPLDVLEFALMEVFQEKWRSSRAGLTFVNNLHRYPAHQRMRMAAVMRQYIQWMEADASIPALLSLQTTPTTPFDLYPA